ncbi:unnamed protein product, partial [Symbiodinium sp. CCMP2456]
MARTRLGLGQCNSLFGSWRDVGLLTTCCDGVRPIAQSDSAAGGDPWHFLTLWRHHACSRTWVQSMPPCRPARSWCRALALLCWHGSRSRADRFGYSSLLDAMANSVTASPQRLPWEAAVDLLRVALVRLVEIDSAVENAAISCCSLRGDWCRSSLLLSRLWAPDNLSLSFAIASCATACE